MKTNKYKFILLFEVTVYYQVPNISSIKWIFTSDVYYGECHTSYTQFLCHVVTLSAGCGI